MYIEPERDYKGVWHMASVFKLHFVLRFLVRGKASRSDGKEKMVWSAAATYYGRDPF